MNGNKKNPINTLLARFEECMLTLEWREVRFLMLVLSVSVCVQVSVDMSSFMCTYLINIVA